MSVADNIRQLKIDIDETFKAGSKAFWDAYTKNALSVDCRYMFAGAAWTNDSFKPPYDEPLKPNPTASRYMFQDSGITKITKEQIDFSNATNLRQTFSQSNIEEAYVDASKAYLYNTFETIQDPEATKLELIVSDKTTYRDAFKGFTSLTELRIYGKEYNTEGTEFELINGTIGNGGFDLTDCTYLSVQSIKSVLNACNKENANITVTLPYYCIDGKTITSDICFMQLSEEYNAAIANDYFISWN